MDPIVVYILLINSAVAVVAGIIALAQQRFHRRVERDLSLAIDETKRQVTNEISTMKEEFQTELNMKVKGIEKTLQHQLTEIEKNVLFQITTRTQLIDEAIEQRMNQMEKRMYMKLEDPETFNQLAKRLADWAHGKWMTQMKALDKKVKKMKREVGMNGGDMNGFTMLLSNWDEEKGLIGNLMSNKAAVAKLVQPKDEPGVTVDAVEEQGPPSWWTEEDQHAMEEFVMQRNELHVKEGHDKVNIEP